MNKYEIDLSDGTLFVVEADYYNKERSGKNLEEFIDWDYVFYRDGEPFKRIPCYWFADKKPKLVVE